MRARRGIVILLALSSLFALSGITPGHAYTTSCTSVETAAFPTQVPQTIGCDVRAYNSSCDPTSEDTRCLWTAKVTVQGVGVVGARVRISSYYTRFYVEDRCGFAASSCAVAVQMVPTDPCRPWVTGCAAYLPATVDAVCDWQGVVAVQVRIFCELTGVRYT